MFLNDDNGEVVICGVCKGLGKIQDREKINIHHNEWDEWDIACRACDGTGRVVKLIDHRKLLPEELEIKPRKGDNYERNGKI